MHKLRIPRVLVAPFKFGVKKNNNNAFLVIIDLGDLVAPKSGLFPSMPPLTT